jgi:y4mF family transcriptional regulator
MQADLQNIVRQHRRLSGLTQAGLAMLAGVGKTVVFDIEHGKESIRFDTLKKVLASLNIRLIPRSPVLDGRENEQAKRNTPAA